MTKFFNQNYFRKIFDEGNSTSTTKTLLGSNIIWTDESVNSIIPPLINDEATY